jgi:hypothetical protein
MENKSKKYEQNNAWIEHNVNTTHNNIYDDIPDKYTIEEKNEIIRIMNEYADICVSILEHSKNDK